MNDEAVLGMRTALKLQQQLQRGLKLLHGEGDDGDGLKVRRGRGQGGGLGGCLVMNVGWG